MNAIQSAGGVNIERIDLLTTPEAGSQTIDLTDYVGQIVIQESIFTNYFTCEVAMGDARNLIGNVPILGGEILTLRLVSKHLSGENKNNIIEQSFVVHSITDRNYVTDREQVYKLKCITPEGYKNNTIVINERFVGSPRSIFNDIYDRFIKEPKVIGTDSSEDHKGLQFLSDSNPFKRDSFAFNANYWTPYRCMNYLTGKVAPADVDKPLMPNTKYFQSNKGHYVVSLSRLNAFYKDQGLIYDEFNQLPAMDEPFMLKEKRKKHSGYEYTSPFVSSQYNTMAGLTIPHYTNDLEDQLSGYQGNMTVGFDMTTRLPYHMEFDYTPKQKVRKEQNQRVIPTGWHDFFHVEKKSPSRMAPISEPRSSLNVKIGSSQIYTDQPFGYDWRHFQDVALRDTALEELKRLRVEFSVAGRTDVDLGMLVALNFPNTQEKGDGSSEEDVYDKRISGLYTITGLRHTITCATQDHNMRMVCVRDSMGEIE